MRLSDFNFDLPKELIAQHPLERRGDSRLLVIRKNRKEILHSYFRNLPDYLDPDDLLILNNTRVIPARLIGKKELTGGKVEILLTKKINNNCWCSLIKPNSRVKTGATINFNKKIKAISNHGMHEKYFHEYIGVNSRLDTIQAALLLEKMKYIEENINNRKKIAKIYNTGLKNIEDINWVIHVDDDYELKINSDDYIIKNKKLQKNMYTKK